MTPIISVMYVEKLLIVSLVVLAMLETKSAGNVINVNIIGYIRGLIPYISALLAR